MGGGGEKKCIFKRINSATGDWPQFILSKVRQTFYLFIYLRKFSKMCIDGSFRFVLILLLVM